jgi:hypothetical protein
VQRCGRQFNLRDQGGLQVLVVITSSTHIVVSGGGVGVVQRSLRRDPVEVNGRDSGDHVVATTVTVR